MSPELEQISLSYPVRVLGLEHNFRFEVTCQAWPWQPCAVIRGFNTRAGRRDGDGALARARAPHHHLQHDWMIGADDRTCIRDVEKKTLDKTLIDLMLSK
jgi:hypothetical protein